VFRFGIVFLVSLSLYGCADRRAALQNSVENYVKALRRGEPEMAVSFVKPEKRIEFAKTLEHLDTDLMVSEVELKNITPDEKLENAVVTVLMEYFDQYSSSVTTKKTSSLWKYDEKSKAWLIDSSSAF